MDLNLAMAVMIRATIRSTVCDKTTDFEKTVRTLTLVSEDEIEALNEILNARINTESFVDRWDRLIGSQLFVMDPLYQDEDDWDDARTKNHENVLSVKFAAWTFLRDVYAPLRAENEKRATERYGLYRTAFTQGIISEETCLRAYDLYLLYTPKIVVRK